MSYSDSCGTFEAVKAKKNCGNENFVCIDGEFICGTGTTSTCDSKGCRPKPNVESFLGIAVTSTVTSLSSTMVATIPDPNNAASTSIGPLPPPPKDDRLTIGPPPPNDDRLAIGPPPPKDDRLAIGLGVGISSIVLLLGAAIAVVFIRKRKAKKPGQSNLEDLLEPQGTFAISHSLPPPPAPTLSLPTLSLLFLHDTDFAPSLLVAEQLERKISSMLSLRYKVSTETVGIAGLPEEIEIELDRFDCVLVAVHKVDRFLIYREGKIVHRLKDICSQHGKRFVPIVYDTVSSSVGTNLTESLARYEGCPVVYCSLSYALLPKQKAVFSEIVESLRV
ncbi:hypothetical protein BDR26DRAFT_857219 [Obelidium mucronatum]|nr:hypothetical protein BDR26DRAFT_857219 [Obelidium mucronatum]